MCPEAGLPDTGGFETRPYRLVALDLDDTILGRDLVFRPRVKRAVQALRGAGMMVTLATGRMFQSALPFAQELGITLPLICYQGALIQDPVSREVLFHQPVPQEEARRVIEIVRQWGLHVNAYVDDELYVEKVTPEAERYVRIARVPLHDVGDLLSFLKGCRGSSRASPTGASPSGAAPAGASPTKLVIVSDESTINKALGELRAVFGPSLYITKSLPMFCEIAHPGCNKGAALEFLAKYLGVSREETVAIGDGLNDLEMIQWAGLGIAMGHAPPEVKAAADWVTGSFEEDGASQALEHILQSVPTPT